MFYCQAIVDQFFERIDPDMEMCVGKLLCDLFIALGGLNAAVDHRLV